MSLVSTWGERDDLRKDYSSISDFAIWHFEAFYEGSSLGYEGLPNDIVKQYERLNGTLERWKPSVPYQVLYRRKKVPRFCEVCWMGHRSTECGDVVWEEQSWWRDDGQFKYARGGVEEYLEEEDMKIAVGGVIHLRWWSSFGT